MQPKSRPLSETLLAQALDALHTILQQARNPRDPMALYRRIFRAIRAVVPYDAAFLDLYDAEADSLNTVYEIDEQLENTALGPWDYRQSAGISWIMQHRQPLIFANLNQDLPRFLPTASVRNFGNIEKQSRSWMTIPLIAEDRLVGLFNLQSYQEGMYGDFELELLQTIATPLAVTIENERMLLLLMQATLEFEPPLLRLTPDVLLLPLIGSLEAEQITAISRQLRRGINHLRARIAILDITAVAAINPELAAAILEASQSVRLLGAEVYLSGISAEAAQTLMALELDLAAMRTFATLQEATAAALEQAEV